MQSDNITIFYIIKYYFIMIYSAFMHYMHLLCIINAYYAVFNAYFSNIIKLYS